MSVSAEQSRLLSLIAGYPSCVVAFSGGVDSAVVAKAAHVALGERALAVTSVSASLATGELATAQRIARSIGIRHETIATEELARPGYVENSPQRCWHCKTELYTQLSKVAEREGLAAILNGTNADDLGDFRPGLQAAAEHRVVSPLAECGINKQGVRTLAQAWDLEVWDKPAAPCLASRVVYGLEVTSERLQRIDRAECFLKELGFRTVRVRCHQDELARLEVAAEEVERLVQTNLRGEIAARLRELGFRYVTVDIEGFRSGSFVQLVPSEQLLNGRRPAG
jgi:uncharacterized protein